MKPHSLWLRTGFFLFFAALASLASGCVYLRLLQFKNQLADFEKHFSADASDGLCVICKEPVLLGDDLRWLGAEPETIQRNGTAASWTIRWIKEMPTDGVETGVYDIELHAEMAERKLRSIQIPERYFGFVSKALFLDALRSAGHAKIDRQTREAVMDTSSDGPESPPPPVNLGSIEKMLGLPTERAEDAESTRFRYVFRPQTPTGPGRPIEVSFLFSRTTGNLRKLTGKLPKGTLNFEFPEPPDVKK